VSPTIGVMPEALSPSALVQTIAFETAQQMAVAPLPAPYPISSYSLQFFGPSLQCLNANSSQQPAFDSFTRAFALQSGTFTLPLLQTAQNLSKALTPYAVVFLAASSTLFNTN
jgi:hypothetical protein